MKVSWKQALAWRMRRQHLIEPARAGDLVSVVERLCGLHAQVLSSAELALWARIDGLRRTHMADALWNERSLVKLWAMRGTLHILAARDLGLWVAGLRVDDRAYNHPGIDTRELYDAAELVGNILNGEVLTRSELAGRIAQASDSKTLVAHVEGNWGGKALKRASFLGQLCFAPSIGQRVRFTSPASWIDGGVADMDSDAALTEIARRFLSAYAPATTGELGGWFGGGVRDGERRIAELDEEATQVKIDGKSYWMLTQDAFQMVSTEPTNVARMLPGFDPWVVSSSCREPAMLDPQHRRRVRRMQGWISPVLLVNGQIAGVWRHQRKGKRLMVELEAFKRLPKWAINQLEADAVRLSAFLGGTLELTHR